MIHKEYFVLSNGIKIPKLGFGTWQIPNENACECCLYALRSGYRHIDTAKAYGNEEGVGEAIKASKLNREDIFITSKIPAEVKTYEGAKRCIKESLDLLGVDYIDLMLIHAPRPWDEMRWDFEYRYYKENIEVYRALEEVYEQGKIKSLGVSNFSIDDLKNIFDNSKIKPMVNQICVFIGETPIELIEFCQKEDILVEAYSPLGTGRLFKNEFVKQYADKYGVSIAQLAIRYTYQLGTLPLPKSVNPDHILNNMDINGFTISDEDMEALKKYNIWG